MEELIGEFVGETREMLQAIECELVAWEKDPADRTRIDAIFRVVHTVKGNSGFFDLPRLQALSHAAEDILNELRHDRRRADTETVDTILAAVDRIALLIDSVEAGRELEDVDDCLARIAALLEKPAHKPDSPVQDDVPVAQTPDAAASAEAAGHEPRAIAAKTIRLPLELVDRVMTGVSDMVLIRNELESLFRRQADADEVEGSFRRLSAILATLRETISEARMQPVSTLFSSYRRKVRDLASDLGKKVEFEIESGQVELDREVVELVRDPLLHLVHNALDHGLELPGERMAAGKPDTGMLRLSARQSGNEVRIAVIDDGRGIDGDALIEKARAMGVASEAELAALGPQERLNLIFHPGLSTAREASAVSGRGVGMDVVRDSIERLGGSITISSDPGQGTHVMLRLPLTLSIVPCIIARVGDQQFAIPQSYVAEIRQGGTLVEAPRIGGIRQITVRGEQFSCIGMGKALDVADAAPPMEQTLLLVRLLSGDVFALGVDSVEGRCELVVKPIPESAGGRLYVGAAQLEDGRPALVVDPGTIGRENGLVSADRSALRRRADQLNVVDEMAETTRQFLVFTDLEGTLQALPVTLAARVVHIQPDRLQTAAGCTSVLLGSEVLPIAGPCTPGESADQLSLLIVDDGARRIGLISAGAVETVRATDISRQRIRFGDTVAQRVDCHGALASALAMEEATGPIVALDLADGWTNDVLRPLVEEAGYRIVGKGDESADLAITGEDEAGSPGSLFITAREADEKARVLVRYDRAAILHHLDELSRAGTRERGAA
jgi:two-component system chemotaxis sensor kinase CheA